MAVSVTQIKDFIAREYTAATQEVHNFVAWLEQKDAQLAAAKSLLENNGYTVTAKAP
jgi:hypothetical protein